MLTTLFAFFSHEYKDLDIQAVKSLSLDEQLKMVDVKRLSISNNRKQILVSLYNKLPQLKYRVHKRIKLKSLLSSYVLSYNKIQNKKITELTPRQVALSLCFDFIDQQRLKAPQILPILCWEFAFYFLQFCNQQTFNGHSLKTFLYEQNDNDANISSLISKICQQYSLKMHLFKEIKQYIESWLVSTKFELGLTKMTSSKNNISSHHTIVLIQIRHFFDFLTKNEVSNQEIQRLERFLQTEDYDSEAIENDIDFRNKKNSNILMECQNEKCLRVMCKYYDKIQVRKTSLAKGVLFWYWIWYKHRVCTDNEAYIDPKYENLKEELLMQKHDFKHWQHILKKSVLLLGLESIRNIKAANRDEELHYDIFRDTPLQQSNLQALIIWFEFNDINESFTNTFVPIETNEPQSNIAQRHRKFYHLAKTLRETVQYYGETRNKGPFYMSLDTNISIPSFSLTFNSPRSVSMDYHKVNRGCKDYGVMLQLNNDIDYESRNHFRCFKRFWRHDGNEYLFFDPKYAIRLGVTIKMTKIDNKNKKKEFSNKCLYLLDCMLSGINMEGAFIQSKQDDIKTLAHLVAYEFEESVKQIYPSYIYETFHSFCVSKMEITTDINMLNLYFGKEMRDLLFYPVIEDDDKPSNNNEKKNLFKSKLLKLFPNLKQITLVTTSTDGSDSYSLSPGHVLEVLNGINVPELRKITIKASSDVDYVHSFITADSWLDKLWQQQSLSLQTLFSSKQWKVSFDSKKHLLLIEKDQNTNNLDEQQGEINSIVGKSIHCIVSASKMLIDECKYIRRLIFALEKFIIYGTDSTSYKSDSEQQLKQFFKSDEYQSLVNRRNTYETKPNVFDDYIHLITTHQQDIARIHSELTTSRNMVACNSNDCSVMRRRRDRRNARIRNGKQFGVYTQLFDCIHSILFHSFAVTEENKEDTNTYSLETSKFTMQTIIEYENDLLEEVCIYLQRKGTELREVERFCNFARDEEYDSDVLIYDTDAEIQDSNLFEYVNNLTIIDMLQQFFNNAKVSKTSFSTGLAFYYWPYYRNIGMSDDSVQNKLYVTKKYNDFKTEILRQIPMAQYSKLVYYKSCEIVRTIKAKELSAVCANHLHYDTESGASIREKHLMAIILYCDFTELCTSFSKTFRAKERNESLESIKLRNSEYWWMSRHLREAVQLYGENRYDETGPFYTGLSFEMYIYQFNIRLCSPTSTTIDKQQSNKFAGSNGMIIQFNNNGDLYNSKRIRFFNTEWISTYPEERERLFFGGDFRLRIQSVTILLSKESFPDFFHALYLFDCMLTGSSTKGSKNITITRRDKQILSSLIKNKLNIKHCQYSRYIRKTFQLFCFKKTKLVINVNQLDWYFNEFQF
eukprot:284606_1